MLFVLQHRPADMRCACVRVCVCILRIYSGEVHETQASYV